MASFSFFSDPHTTATLNFQTGGTPGIDFTGCSQAAIHNLNMQGLDVAAASACAILQKRMTGFGNSGNVWIYDVNISGYFTVCNIMNIGQEVGGYQNVVCRISADSSKSILPICNFYAGGMDKTSPGIPSPYVTAEPTNQGLTGLDINGCQFSAGDTTTLHNMIFVTNCADIKVENTYVYGYGLAAVKFYQYAGASAAGYQETGVDFDDFHAEGTQTTATFWAYSDDDGNISLAPTFKNSGGQTAPLGLYFQNIAAVTYGLNIDGLPCSGIAVKADGDLDNAHMQRLGYPGQGLMALQVGGYLQFSTVTLDSAQSYSVGQQVIDSKIYSIPNGAGSGTLLAPGKITWGGSSNTANSVTWGQAAPTSGNYAFGDIILNNSQNSQTPFAWQTNYPGGSFFSTQLSGITGTIAAGSNALTVNNLSTIAAGNFLYIAGTYNNSGGSIFQVTGIDPTNKILYLRGASNSAVSGAAITYAGPPTFTAVNAYLPAAHEQLTGTNSPTAPASTSAYTMQGLAGSITPTKSGNVLITICGTIIAPTGTTVDNGIKYQISYGTGSAPGSNATLTGTQIGVVQEWTNPVALSAAGDLHVPFSISVVVTGLTQNTPYWIDLAAESVTTASDIGFTNVGISAHEF